MEIPQKRLSNRATFAFGDDELRYTMKDSSGSHSFGVEYGAIPDDVAEFEERNGWYFKAGIFWVGLGLVQIGTRWAETGRVRGSIWLTLGVVCIIAYEFLVTKYTTINTANGRIFIIKDRNHDRVLTELDERRKL